MKVIKINEIEQFNCVPRNYPSVSDELTVTLINEMTNEPINLSFTFSISDAYLTIIVNEIPNDFKSGEKYSITIKNITKNNYIIYLGKLMIVDENTDIQNYEYQSQSNSRFNY
jgi:hypothetical protein